MVQGTHPHNARRGKVTRRLLAIVALTYGCSFRSLVTSLTNDARKLRMVVYMDGFPSCAYRISNIVLLGCHLNLILKQPIPADNGIVHFFGALFEPSL